MTNAQPDTSPTSRNLAPRTVLPVLTASINGYGKEILVEKTDSGGRPEIWYATETSKDTNENPASAA